MAHTLKLRTIPGQFGICKLKPEESIPSWTTSGNIWSITRRETELSVVCLQENIPKEINAERNWRMLQIVGPLAFEMVGVLSSLTIPLAERGLSIITLSTYETDLILVKEKSFEVACHTLTKAGHIIT